MVTDDSEAGRPAKRIRLACLRCQGRKIKCDGGLPKCSACQRANADCVDGKKTGEEGIISRNEAAALHNRIQQLEALLQTTRPTRDIDSLSASSGFDLPPTDNVQQRDTIHNVQNSGQHNGTVAEAGFAPNDTGQQSLPDEPDLNEDRSEEPPGRNEIAHDIGLVPLSSGVNKYIGPSSGLAFTKLIFNRVGRNSDFSSIPHVNLSTTAESPSTTTSRSLLVIEPAPLPASLTQAVQLSKIYFEHVHVQYPFLHEPTYFFLLTSTYNDPHSTPTWVWFQITMVLAISASILAKRLPIPFSGESLCASAMREADKVDMQSSTQGLQCLLLIYMFTLHSSFCEVSPWHLNYQCLATVLDLGLQRELPNSNTINAFEREMRTRTFWVVYSIDRTLATTLGRPIGLRDEACDLRRPNGTDDCELFNPAIQQPSFYASTLKNGSMACAATLFELAQLNSEIKYVLHSVSHKTPRYTYPQIPDIDVWQQDIWERLKDCNSRAPKFADQYRYLTVLCEIRYNEVVMHLFRPTPRIRTPSTPSLKQCYASAKGNVELWKELYEADRMSYSWVTIHSVCLSALTILYCIWTSADVAASVQIYDFTNSVRDASVLLSAAGEYWTEARRSRSRLDSLANATVRWLIDKLSGNRTRRAPQRSQRRRDASLEATATSSASVQEQGHATSTSDELPSLDLYISDDDLAAFLGAPDLPNDNGFLIEGMFSDFQPLFDFGGADIGSSFMT